MADDTTDHRAPAPPARRVRSRHSLPDSTIERRRGSRRPTQDLLRSLGYDEPPSGGVPRRACAGRRRPSLARLRSTRAEAEQLSCSAPRGHPGPGADQGAPSVPEEQGTTRSPASPASTSTSTCWPRTLARGGRPAQARLGELLLGIRCSTSTPSGATTSRSACSRPARRRPSSSCGTSRRSRSARPRTRHSTPRPTWACGTSDRRCGARPTSSPPCRPSS
jgi:hypothetical protein